MLASLCLQVLARNVSPAAQLEESAFLTALVEEIRAAGPSKHTVVLDVGANDGEFSEELMRTRACSTGRRWEGSNTSSRCGRRRSGTS